MKVVNKVSEEDLETILESFFVHKSTDCKVGRQVYYGGKRIDLVVLEDSGYSAIEVKLSDWRGALKQASLNKTACEASYVAIWRNKARSAIDNLHEFAAKQVGLIVIDELSEPIFLFSPSKNDRFLPQAKEALVTKGVV